MGNGWKAWLVALLLLGGSLWRLVAIVTAFTIVATSGGTDVRSDSGIRVGADLPLGDLARSRKAVDTVCVLGGLGVFIFRGVASVDSAQILAGAVPAAAIALLSEGCLGWIERRFSPV